MVRMVTTSDHVYAGRALKAGDEFDCEPQHVILMTVRNCAVRKDEKQQYQTRDMVAGRRLRNKRA